VILFKTVLLCSAEDESAITSETIDFNDRNGSSGTSADIMTAFPKNSFLKLVDGAPGDCGSSSAEQSNTVLNKITQVQSGKV